MIPLCYLPARDQTPRARAIFTRGVFLSAVWFGLRRCVSAALVSPVSLLLPLVRQCFALPLWPFVSGFLAAFLRILAPAGKGGETKAAEKHRRNPNQTAKQKDERDDWQRVFAVALSGHCLPKDYKDIVLQTHSKS
jgi:hypothetical protein